MHTPSAPPSHSLAKGEMAAKHETPKHDEPPKYEAAKHEAAKHEAAMSRSEASGLYPLQGPLSSVWRIAGPVISVGIFVVSLGTLYYILRELDANAVKTAFAHTSRTELALALAFTALSYAILSLYDLVALPSVTRLVVPPLRAILGAFTAYAVSFTLGFPLITAATVRFWVYGQLGLGARAVATLTVITGLPFWLGMALVLGSVFVISPPLAASVTRLPMFVHPLLGLGLFALVGLYLLKGREGHNRLRVGKWKIRFPNRKVMLLQLILGAADVSAGAAVLYILLPGEATIAFPTMLAAYVLACLLGILSHAPGGLGVFEATLLLALPGVPKEALLGALLIYRLCYYIIPFIIALILLGGNEIYQRSKRFKQQMNIT